MNFKKYSSIENVYREKTINSIIQQGLNKGEYVCTVKVHGANFSFIYDKQEVKVAKRTDLTDGSFYSCQSVIDKYSERVVSLFNDISQHIKMDQIQIYGELFGGAYPGIKTNTKAVQKGIWYSDKLDFYAFDISYTVDDKVEILDFDLCLDFLEKHGFFYAKPVFRGSFEECLKYPNEFKDPIHEWLGMPPLEENNITEGVVIKPVDAKFFLTGERVILKNKNEKWSEKKNAKSREPKEPIQIPEHIQTYITEAQSYINENRLKNVLSKVGQVTDKDFGLVMGMFTKDAIEDFIGDNPTFKELSKNDQKIITKSVGSIGAVELRKHFLNIIDGEF